LAIFVEGEELEEVYVNAKTFINRYFDITIKNGMDFPSASDLDIIKNKWKGYKVPLVTASA